MEKWLLNAQKGLEWFIVVMGEQEWHRRREKVTEYFHSLKSKPFSDPPLFTVEEMKKFSPIAVYDDWISWYMYLMESVILRQGCDDPYQSARIYPFFATIGRNLDSLKEIHGIDKRMEVLLNQARNQPDSGLYELCVAALYCRNGWDVFFQDEDYRKKTTDLMIRRGEEVFWVECKRLAKVPEYAETERKEWLIRMLHLFKAMEYLQIDAFVEVIFRVPIEMTDPIVLGAAITHYVQSGKIDKKKLLENDQIQLKARRLDINKINDGLKNNSIRPNSPLMIKFLTGEYDMHGNYSHQLIPSLIEVVNPDNPLFVLNEFYAGLKSAMVVKYSCIAEESIERKAKDIRKMLSKAIEQVPKDGKGIIHIGYETVLGPEVEKRREQKIRDTISDFSFGNISIEAIYFNAIQPLTKSDGFECAETTIYFENNNTVLLEETLLLDQPGAKYDNTTHWEQDLEKK